MAVSAAALCSVVAASGCPGTASASASGPTTCSGDSCFTSSGVVAGAGTEGSAMETVICPIAASSVGKLGISVLTSSFSTSWTSAGEVSLAAAIVCAGEAGSSTGASTGASSKLGSCPTSWVFRGCLGRLWTPKNLEKLMVFQGFTNAGFRYVQAFDGPLGPVLAPLGPIWSQNDLQNKSPNRSKSTLKSVKIGPLQVKTH